MIRIYSRLLNCDTITVVLKERGKKKKLWQTLQKLI